MFMEALKDHEQFATALGRLVTPESRNGWGDFGAAAERLASIPDMQFSTQVDHAFDAADVAYLKVFSGIGTFENVGNEPLALAARLFITVVFRPEVNGGWLVHHIGQQLRPAEVPRSPERR